MTATTEEGVFRDIEASEEASNTDDIVALVNGPEADTSETAVPEPSGPSDPVIQVVKGSPTDDELAALIAVLGVVASSPNGATPSAGPAELWGRPTLLHRGTPPFSPYSFPYLSHLRD